GVGACSRSRTGHPRSRHHNRTLAARASGATNDNGPHPRGARAVGGAYDASPLALGASIWLAALDPQQSSDRPLPIDWAPAFYQDAERWDVDYRLFSHYDIRERILDWISFASVAPSRHPGVSVWTLAEPLMRIPDGRSQTVLAVFAEASDETETPIPAAAMLDRARVAGLLRAYVASPGR
ncbi:MAG: hypothetical protein WCI61_10795, partial [Chloroflexota bacterium]